MKNVGMFPKILIVSRLTWVDNSNSNTLTNIFSGYPPEKIARIYIETLLPQTKCCNRFFQISEISLLKKLVCTHVKTGRYLDSKIISKEKEQEILEKQEQKIMSFVRKHRSLLFTFLRDILWGFDGWKSCELRNFIIDFDPDVLWLDGSPLILMNRLNNYVKKVAQKPSVTFLMDDVYCYESCTGFGDKIYKYFLRSYVKKTVKESRHVFVASPKMKVEYDSIFGINSTFIAKSIDSQKLLRMPVAPIHKPVRLVYLGNILIGRLESLICMAECIKEINKNKKNLELSIYTSNYISQKNKKRLLVDSEVKLCHPVSYNEVYEVIQNNDVQVFVESLKGANTTIARLSFSTKIVDYLGSGKCILAVGPRNIAPIEYFQNEDAALVATSKAELKESLLKLCSPTIVIEYAEKAKKCGIRNHDRIQMQNLIYSILENTAKEIL
jgi:hypothetical protein